MIKKQQNSSKAWRRTDIKRESKFNQKLSDNGYTGLTKKY